MQVMHFLRWEAGTPFSYGRHDCSLRLADWWKFVTGTDPAEALRGRYASKSGARVRNLRAGGLVRLVETLAEGAGARLADEITAGTFGVARLAGTEAGYIATTTALTFRMEGRGIVFLPSRDVEVLSRWDVA